MHDRRLPTTIARAHAAAQRAISMESVTLDSGGATVGPHNAAFVEQIGCSRDLLYSTIPIKADQRSRH